MQTQPPQGSCDTKFCPRCEWPLDVIGGPWMASSYLFCSQCLHSEETEEDTP